MKVFLLEISVSKVCCAEEAVMESTRSNGSEESIYDVIFPLYAVYVKLLFFILINFFIVASSLVVIFAIVRNKKLRNTNNLLIVNLLVSDIIYTFIYCGSNVFLLLKYLIDLKADDYCSVFAPVSLWLSIISRLMVVPLIVYRLVSIARPFSYKRFVTKRRMITMIISLWGFETIIVYTVDYHPVYIPSLGSCALVELSPLPLLSALGPDVISCLLLVIVSVYLRHKIIKSNNFFHAVQRNASDREKARRLVETLTKMVKPTVSVLISGGIDAVLDFLAFSIYGILNSFASPLTQLQLTEMIVIPLILCQTLSHSPCFGLYNKEIREKVFSYYPKQTNVVVFRP